MTQAELKRVATKLSSVQELQSHLMHYWVSTSVEQISLLCRSLDGKIEKRRAELKRAETRLSSLAAVRPAYMDELEGLQANLQQLFAVYLQKHRSGLDLIVIVMTMEMLCSAS